MIAAILTLTFGLFLIYIPYIFMGKLEKMHNMYQCHVEPSSLSDVMTAIHGLLYCIIPSCIIVTTNIIMIRKIHSQKKFQSRHQASSHHRKSKRNTNLTLTMFAVCLVFVVTTLPAGIIFFVRSVTKFLGTKVPPLIILIYKMDNINHGINFVLYCVTGSVFRQTLVKLFTCHKDRSLLRAGMQQCAAVEAGV